MPSPRLITFGCRLNAFEAEVMRSHAQGAGMDNETLQLGIRRFLKEFGTSAQKAIEDAVAALEKVLREMHDA